MDVTQARVSNAKSHPQQSKDTAGAPTKVDLSALDYSWHPDIQKNITANTSLQIAN